MGRHPAGSPSSSRGPATSRPPVCSCLSRAIENCMTCGDDLEEHKPGYGQQIGSDVEGLFDAWSKDVLPAFQ